MTNSANKSILDSIEDLVFGGDLYVDHVVTHLSDVYSAKSILATYATLADIGNAATIEPLDQASEQPDWHAFMEQEADRNSAKGIRHQVTDLLGGLVDKEFRGFTTGRALDPLADPEDHEGTYYTTDASEVVVQVVYGLIFALRDVRTLVMQRAPSAHRDALIASVEADLKFFIAVDDEMDRLDKVMPEAIEGAPDWYTTLEVAVSADSNRRRLGLLRGCKDIIESKGADFAAESVFEVFYEAARRVSQLRDAVASYPQVGKMFLKQLDAEQRMLATAWHQALDHTKRGQAISGAA